MKKLLGIGVALILIVSLAAPALAATTVYTSSTAWETAVGTWATEDFADATLNPEITVATTNGTVQAGSYLPGSVWWDLIDEYEPATTTWTFANSIVGFGGTWHLAGPSGPGSDLEVSLDGASWVWVGQISRNTAGTFWGFVSDTPFTQVRITETGSGVERYELDDMVYSEQTVEVDKEWSYTNVVFAIDDDGDGLYNEEDPNDGLDNDGDLLIDEDPIEAYNTISSLTQLEAKVKNGTIKTITPGQFYAVSTVEVLEDMAQLVITEDYSGVVPEIGELNPAKGGGRCVVVKMEVDYMGNDMPVQILDAMDPEVVVGPTTATVTLSNVVAGEVYLVYVKFAPTQKGDDWESAIKSATNYNSVGPLTAEATIVVGERP